MKPINRQRACFFQTVIMGNVDWFISKGGKTIKKKPALATLLLTTLFSFVATSVVWADCDENPVVCITPSSPQCVAQEFCATTTLCGEAVAGIYTWTATGVLQI